MAIYRGEGGKTDVVPADGDQEFAGSIIAEKDIHAHGNISADGDITVGGDIHWTGTISGDGSGLENVPTPFLQADDCIYLNNQVITNDYTMPVGKNGMTAGDVTINGEVEIPMGSDWHIIGQDDKVVTLESLGIPNHDQVTVDSTGHLKAFGIESESPYVGDGSLLTGIPRNSDVESLAEQVEDNTTDIETNSIAIQENKDAIQENTDAINAIPDAIDAYTKTEIDAQQDAQDIEINKKANTTDVDAKNVTQDAEIAKKLGDAPEDGEQYVRKDGVWAELAAADGGITDAPADGKTYGRKNYDWEEIVGDGYTKAEIDAQQLIQDAEITANTTDIATNTADIAENKTNIQQNTTDIESLIDDVDALTGSVIYKGSLNATVTPAPADAVVGDMYINEYNVSEPATNYPVASGWSPVTEVKYDDKLIKTDAGWDKIASVVGVPTYTAGEIDDLLDDKADKGDSYLKAESDATNEAQDALIQANTDAIDALPTPVDAYSKTETDTLLDNKSNVGDSYTKAESDTALNAKADKSTTYTKTEVDTSQALQDTEIAKKANQDTTYTKDEVDSLLESASGAIVGNYTNKHAASVARDPGVGNLYLSNGMSFSTDYNAVTSIYISDTDGDGDVRDFDEVQVSDKITLTSENGSGEYTIVTISDVGGYRELVVNTDSATGTIANDTPVSIVLDVASSGETGGGIEEAPADGKQYARQDEAWTEVEATSGGVTAQPPVAFSVQLKDSINQTNLENAIVNLETVDLDTDNAWKGDHYLIPKDGIYNLQAATYVSDSIDLEPLHQSGTYITKESDGESTILARALNQVGTGSEATKEHGPRNNSNTVSVTCELKKGDQINLKSYARTHSGSDYVVSNNGLGRTFLSGHMVSSITEGEVKEKEPVAFRGHLSSNQTFTSGEYTKLNLDTTSIDTDNALVDGKFKPSVAGWYQVNGMISQACTPNAIQLTANIYKNGSLYSYGAHVKSEEVLGMSVHDVIYLDGKDDYLELYGRGIGTGTCAFNSVPTVTYLSAVLVSGGSASGDSIWTEESGVATYDGDVIINGGTNVKGNMYWGKSGKGRLFSDSNWGCIFRADTPSPNQADFMWQSADDVERMRIGSDGTVSTTQDMKVNGVTVGTGGGNVNTNTVLGKGALNKNALGNSNTVIGTDALYNNEGNGNIAIGYRAGNNMTNSSNNILIGDSVQASTLTTSNEVTIGNDSITKTRLKGDVQTTKKDKKVTIDANVGELGLKSRITTDASILELKAGSGGLPDVTISDTEINLGSDTVTTTRLKGSLFAQGVWNDTASVGETPNVCVGNDGKLFRSLTTTYTTEEVDKKLAVKDKLIEKLSARLDKLEKRIK